MFGGNVTADNFFGNLTWTDLNNYPVACPAGSAITQLNDSVTCTSFLQSSSSGQDLTNLSLSKGLVAFYPFSTGARDLSGQGNDGTVIGATHNGIGGFNGAGAYEFDGVDDYVELPDTSTLYFENSSYSMSLWLKIQNNKIEQALLQKYTAGFFPGPGILWDGDSVPQRFKIRHINNTNSYEDKAFNFDGGISDNVWYHLAYTFDNSQDTSNLKVYVDGTLIGTRNMIIDNGINTYWTIGVKERASGFLRWLNGSMDEVMMFNRVLSSEEVKRLYELRPHETSTIFDENVGIGTTTPQNKLNVIGDGNFTGDLYVTANFTLGQKITFALGETIDNIVDGWVRITGSLNVTGNADVIGNFTAGTIQADNGYTGFCVNTTFVGGIATACND